MNKTRMMLTTLGALIMTIAFATAAQAVTFRSHVSITGSDANTATNCPRTNPCRNFSAAYSVTSPGGEIVALDSGGFGGLSITTAVTVMALPGQTAFTAVATGTSGINVGAGANDVVILRNITFGGSGAANTTGISLAAGKLVVENCNFSQLTTGISAGSAGGSLIQNSSFHGNGSGLIATAGKNDVRKSTFSYNSTRGIRATTNGIINLQDVQVSNNAVGVNVSGFGGCRSTNPIQAPTTAVYIELGAVTSNAIGFLMENPGAACANSGASHGQNIWIRNDGGTASAVTPNIINNATTISVPSAPPPPVSLTLGQYQSEYTIFIP